MRILTNHACEFIHRVTSKFIIKHLAYGTHCHVRTKHVSPLNTAHSLSVLRIGSMEVGALLNDAYKQYEVLRLVHDVVIVICILYYY